MAHILTACEDSDVVAAGLMTLKKWRGAWKLRYILTDDSASEQSTVKKAFPGLQSGEQEVTHSLFRTNSESSS
jgi:hypothetical protein